MKNVNSIFSERVQQYSRELQKYLRYILNGHLMFVLIFAIGGGGYAYSNWVQTLTPSFPAAIVMALLLGVIVTLSPVYTYLKEPDKVYLTPLEGQMGRYFQGALISSFALQSYLVLLALAASMPMYVKVQQTAFTDFFWLLAIVLAVKGWNLLQTWHMLRFQERSSHFTDQAVRFSLNVVFLWSVFSGAPVLLTVALAVVMIGYFIAMKRASSQKILKWEMLIQLEEARMTRFYRFANLFTDVPHLKAPAKRRKWLDPVLVRSPFGSSHTYDYLFVRTFLRSDEYFGLVLRLTAIGVILIAGSGVMLVQVGIALVFLYLTGFQLFPVLRKHEFKIWPDLYPVDQELKKKAFRRILSRVLLVQGAVFALTASITLPILNGAGVAAAALVFYGLFMTMYAPKQIQRWSQRFIG